MVKQFIGWLLGPDVPVLKAAPEYLREPWSETMVRAIAAHMMKAEGQ